MNVSTRLDPEAIKDGSNKILHPQQTGNLFKKGLEIGSRSIRKSWRPAENITSPKCGTFTNRGHNKEQCKMQIETQI